MENNATIDPDEKFRALVQTTPDTIIIVDEENKVIFCNNNIEKTFGYTPKELINQDMSIIIPPHLREGHARGMKRFLETRLPKLIGTTLEIVGLRKDGTIFPIELSLSYWKEKDKIYFSSIIRDISDRKKILQELELLQSITEAITDAKDFDSAIGLTLQKVCNLTKWDYGEAWLPLKNKSGIFYSQSYSSPNDKDLKKFAESNHGLIINRGETMAGRVYNNGIEWIPDISLLDKSQFSRLDSIKKAGIKAGLGVPITINNEVIAVLLFFMVSTKNEDSNTIKLIISVAKQLGSVLHRKKAEAALIELNQDLEERVKKRTREVIENTERFKFLADSIPQIVWTASPKGELNYFNKHWYAYTGISYDKSRGWGWKEALHPEDKIDGMKAWIKSIRTGENYQFEFRLKRFLDDTYRWHLARASPMKFDDGSVINWFGTCTDIHDQKMIMESLSSKNKQLNIINSDLDNFVYTASHDLKSPISNLEGLLIALQREIQSGSTESITEIIEMMTTSVSKFKLTIQELADISRIQKDVEVDISSINIAELIEEFKISHHNIIEKSQAKIISDLKIAEIKFSKRNFRSILDNLIHNAIKYSNPKKTPEITIETRSEGEFIIMSVRDNGLGIDLAYKDKIFGMFKRLHDHVEGTGIGLYIVKRIIENSGGKIIVESKLGEGSTFSVFFKVNQKN